MNYWNSTNKKKNINWKEYHQKRKLNEKREMEEELKRKEVQDKAFFRAKKENLNDWTFPFSKMYNEDIQTLFCFLEDYYDRALNFKNFEEYNKKTKYFTKEEDIFQKFLTFRYLKEILIPKIETHKYFEEFLKWKNKEKNEILEFLIPSFPVKIKSGNTKTTSNKDFFPAAYSISNHKFIHYNTKERIDFLAFDLDFYNGKEAIQTFATIESFKQHLITKLGKDLIPSLIIQTSKGYQFFYHLKVPVLTENKKAVKFLRDIKAGMIELLDLDKIASSKLYGVFRGPIKNPTEYTLKKDFQLKDFLKFSKKSNNINTFNNSLYGNSENVNHKSFREGNRNHYLFLRGLIFSNNKKDLTFEIIFNRILGINLKGNKPLQESEVKIIARSVFGYYKTDKINLKILIRKGIMGFEKPSNLSADEFKILVKERQKLSAERTNKIRDKNKNQKALEKAREINSINQQREMINKLQAAKDFLRKNHEKITKAAIQKKSKCDIRTVRKYFDLLN